MISEAVPDEIKPVEMVKHGHAVYSRQIDDVVGRGDRAKKLIDELELLLREVLSVPLLPESLKTRIEKRLENIDEGPKRSA